MKPFIYHLKQILSTNLINIYAALADQTVDDVVAEFAGQGFGAFKPKLAELAVAKLGPINQRMGDLLADPAELDALLKTGADKANAIAEPILQEAYEAVGFLQRG